FYYTPPTTLYTLSLHDALPISPIAVPTRIASVTIRREVHLSTSRRLRVTRTAATAAPFTSTKQVTESQRSFEPSESRKPAMEASDRKSTRLNSSHDQISYAVFC